VPAAAPAADGMPPVSRRQARRHGMRRWLLDRPLWMLVPCAVATIVIIVVPVVLTIILSLLKVDVSTIREWLGAPFIGLRNFVTAFGSANVLGVGTATSLGLSFAFSLLTTAVVTPVGFLAAVSVHRRFRGRALVRALYLIPYIIPTFVVALLARIMFLNQTGLVDKVLSGLGLAGANTYWLIGSKAFWAMTLTEIWATWPFIYLMVLAGLQAIPREQYEAAALDGASPFRKLRTIVLPQVSGVLKLGILLSTLYHFGNFTLAYVMFSSPPPTSVEVLPIATYFNAFSSFDYGTASAMAVVTMVALAIPGYVYLRAARLTRSAD
jgi:multiple sugar transport system permease protein